MNRMEDTTTMSAIPECRVEPNAMTDTCESEERNPKSTILTAEPLRSKAYRLHFSCDYTGRYRKKTKRQIKWLFGLTNLTAVREGKAGSDCRGEEHEVILIWSVKSGKTKVFWNKNNITHLFHERYLFEVVEFSWESRSGEKFEIKAHAKPIPGRPQYDFLVGGASFFSLPHVSGLGGGQYDDTASEHQSEGPLGAASLCSSGHHGSNSKITYSMDFEKRPDDLGFRLSMAGFGAPEFGFEVEDELTADLFTTTLETLRHRVTSCLPETEEMVSKAIISAYSDDRDSSTSFDNSSCDSEPHPPLQLEAEVLRETHDWLSLNVAYAPRPDVEDQKRSFLQKQVASMFVHVKHERISADAAARILTSVAMVLGMKLKIPQPKDTIILSDLDKGVEAEDLIDALCPFGEVDSAAVAKGHGFGICRFLNETGPIRATAAASEGDLIIGGRKPIVSTVCTISRPEMGRRSISAPATSIPKGARLTRQRSHQRNTLTIDSVFPTPEELMAQTQLTPSFQSQYPPSFQPAVITPEVISGFLRPNVFENLPARSSRSIYNDSLGFGSNSMGSNEYARFSPTSMIVLE